MQASCQIGGLGIVAKFEAVNYAGSDGENVFKGAAQFYTGAVGVAVNSEIAVGKAFLQSLR